jgi:hypothetical protein
LLQPGQVFCNPAKSLAAKPEERIRSNPTYPPWHGIPRLPPVLPQDDRLPKPPTTINSHLQQHSESQYSQCKASLLSSFAQF